ncbi:hypothetical protein MHB77_22585 [Paenibacillus sp. FSL K6-3166]|uniref:DUF7667 family protein n=1 Tax=Paenibacillus sp. VTT E-133291 TaxID=1986223 RepID=UPI001180F273|nr:hypothetical protein [Paenibacillus sp. VTT E-133291]
MNVKHNHLDCDWGCIGLIHGCTAQSSGAAIMLPAHLRLAELYHMHKSGTLTEAHGKELQQCL